MKFIHILTSLLLILTFSCNDDSPTKTNTEETDGGESSGGGSSGGGSSGGGSSGGGSSGGGEPEINYSACTGNCIWLENDCNGDWILAYNVNVPIAGFQISFTGINITSASGGAAEEAGFMVTTSSSMVLGASLSGNTIPAGSGELVDIEFTGIPTDVPLNNIIISDSEGNQIDISPHGSDGIINCQYNSSLEQTGESQLTILNESINVLQNGDEIGIFDLQGILNYNDCSNQIGELLVGAGVWNGSQLNIVSTGSVDLCEMGEVQLSGYIEGNPLVMRIYRPSSGFEYLAEISWGIESSNLGTGNFGDIIQSINDITLIQID